MNPAGAPGLGDFVAAYQKKFSSAPRSGHSLANYVGAKAMLEAMSRAKSTDKDKIRDAVLAYRAPVGSTATGWGVQFDETGQNIASTLNLMQWQKGKLATVFPDAVANAKPVLPN
jgi:branched-chain amino acid transport system substrate-binding protein